MNEEPPLVKGGQGRSDKDIEQSAKSLRGVVVLGGLTLLGMYLIHR